MEKFFIKDSSNTVPSKILNRGKSFNFSEWQYGTTYENNEYKQDFVTYDGQLWGCLETNINTPPSLDCEEWSLLLTANSIYKFYWKLFGDNEAKLLSFNRIAKLPEKFVPGEIYYIDELQTVVIGISETEYIEYNASPEIRKQLDENVPFENGSIKNSAILKGGYNQVSNEHEVAIGKYNKSDSEDIIYSVGIGTSDVRKNAHEILQNGKHYILGIGGYDGTNTDDANDLTEEINRIISDTNKIDDLKDAIIDNEKVIAKAFSDHQSKISQNSSDIKQVPFEKGTGNNSAVLKGTSNSATNKFATAFGEQTLASAERAFSEGLKTIASGANSHAEGLSTLAQGQNSHAEGNKCEAIGNHSHAEGNGTIANGGASHAEGSGTITKNNFEHAEGRYNVSNKDRDSDYWGGNNTVHSVGIGTGTKERKNAHEIMQNGKHYIYGIGGYNGTNVLDLDGETATASDLATVVNDKVSKHELVFKEGDGFRSVIQENESFPNTASGDYSSALGEGTTASGYAAHAEGIHTFATGISSHAEGADNIFGEKTPESGDALRYATASGYASHAEGAAHAIGDYSHAEGGGNTDVESEGYKVVSTAEGECSHAEGTHTHAIGGSSHAEGNRTQASGAASHAEGRQTLAEGVASHTEGFNTKTGGTSTVNNREIGPHTSSGAYAHAEGNATIAKGIGSHAEGTKTISIGDDSHAEGQQCVADGSASHAEGRETSAIGFRSHAEGRSSIANGRSSHTEGEYTIANNPAEHAEGKYNKSNSGTIHSVGIGTGTDDNKRKNAHEIMDDGKHYIYDVGDYDGTNPTDSEDLATVINNKAEKTDIVQSDYNQNNVDAKDYIKNRTHYKNDILICYNETIEYDNPFIYTLKILSPIIINWEDTEGTKFETILNESNNYTAVVDGYDCTLDASVDKATLILTVKETYGSGSIRKTYITQREIKELDEQYIPSTIARKTDVSAEVAKIVADAPEAYDTLKEIATYISNDTTKAVEISNTLNEHGNDIRTINTNLNNKVDKIADKGLSTNDYTNDDKNKLSLIEEGAQKNVAPDWNAQESEAGYIKNRPFYTEGDIRQIDVNGEYSIYVGEFNVGDRIDLSWDLDYYNGEIFRGSTSFVIQEEYNIYYEKDNFGIYGDRTIEMYAYGAGDSHYGKVIVTINGEIKILDEKYIPDTIARQSEITRLETAISNNNDSISTIEDKIATIDWVDLSVSSAFEINTGGHIKVKKSGDNVSISLYNLKGKTTDTDVANICVLPDGYQPKYDQYFTCKIGLKTFATIVVTTYGSVNIDKIVLDGAQISPFDMGNLYFSCMFLI